MSRLRVAGTWLWVLCALSGLGCVVGSPEDYYESLRTCVIRAKSPEESQRCRCDVNVRFERPCRKD